MLISFFKKYFSFFSNFLVILFYNISFIDAAKILSIYTLSGIFLNIGYLRDYYLTAINKSYLAIYFGAIMTIFNVVGNLIVIPKFGLVGAAWVTFVSSFVGYFLCNLMFSSTRLIFFVQFEAFFFIKIRKHSNTVFLNEKN